MLLLLKTQTVDAQLAPKIGHCKTIVRYKGSVSVIHPGKKGVSRFPPKSNISHREINMRERQVLLILFDSSNPVLEKKKKHILTVNYEKMSPHLEIKVNSLFCLSLNSCQIVISASATLYLRRDPPCFCRMAKTFKSHKKGDTSPLNTFFFISYILLNVYKNNDSLEPMCVCLLRGNEHISYRHKFLVPTSGLWIY